MILSAAVNIGVVTSREFARQLVFGMKLIEGLNARAKNVRQVLRIESPKRRVIAISPGRKAPAGKNPVRAYAGT
jgi:hypothetical protein